MAEYQELIYKFGADITQFTRSVSEIEAAIKQVSAARKIAVGDEFVKLSATLTDLKQSLANLNQQSLKSLDKNIGDPARQSRIALTSLSQVAQDLPFGFIGIQNNLPNVIQSFQRLRSESPTLGGALKSLGSSLAGPGGLFLAFSVVTAAITALIQKYGSFGEAIDAIFGKTDPLKAEIRAIGKSYEDYNKSLKTTTILNAETTGSLEGQVEKVRILAGVVLDLSQSEHNRKAALEELKKLDKDRFGNYDLETGKLQGLTAEVERYTQSLIANAQTKAFAEELSKTSVEIAKQKIAIKDLTEQRKKLISESATTKVAPAAVGGTVVFSGATESAAKADVLKQGLKSLDNQITESNNNIAALTVTENNWKSSLKESTNAVLKYATGTVTLTDAQKAQQKETKKQNSENERLYKDIVERSEKLEKLIEFKQRFILTDAQGNVKTPDEIRNEILGIVDIDVKPIKVKFTFDGTSFVGNKFEKDANAAADRVRNFTVSKNIQPTFQLPEAQKPTEKQVKAGEEAIKSLDKYKKELDDFNKVSAKTGKTLDDYAQSFEDTQKKLKNAFFAPISNMFSEFLTTGKFTFKSLGDTIKKMIADVAAKIITTGILNSLAKIINPEGSKATNLQGGAFGGGGGGGGFLSSLGSLAAGFLGGGQMNPNFAGVMGGGTEMSGQVNMVLRGTDLVGSINRTNTVINRIG